jgi:hypothetical protein
MPDGREVCTPAEMRRRKMTMIREDLPCAACGKPFDDFRDIELAHIESKGVGGGKRNDARRNLVLMHKAENREQGSRSLADYLVWRKEKGLPTP